ncbi:hypothetical protein V5N11_026557 [Cardamine amara subsp. amara]|uniref:Uncharacterized protein n=1 Tax=Cardamine amara subsp. amara TaxID=228776 RepID=A0ABD0ZZN3_CARAN
MPKPEKETEDDDHLRVSDNNATISNPKVVSLSSEHRLGLGGVFDELGCVVCGSHETVSNLGSCYHALKVSKDVIDVLGMETDSSWLEPLLLGFSGGQQELLGGDYLGAMYDWGICSNNDGIWDFDFCSTPPSLLDDAWMVSGFDPLLGPVDSIIGSTYQTPVTDNWGSVF